MIYTYGYLGHRSYHYREHWWLKPDVNREASLCLEGTGSLPRAPSLKVMLFLLKKKKRKKEAQGGIKVTLPKRMKCMIPRKTESGIHDEIFIFIGEDNSLQRIPMQINIKVAHPWMAQSL